MATKYVVTGEQDKAFYSKRFEQERQWRARVLDPDAVLPVLQALNEPTGKKIIITDDPVPRVDWITDILIRECQCHRDFFGREFNLAEFEKTLRSYGRKKIRMWQKLGLEPHFLPEVSMMAGDDYPGWQVKPEQWFFKKQLEGKMFLNIGGQLTKITTIELAGVSVLVDTRLKPNYDNGEQVYENDNLLGSIIKQLRKEKKIAWYDYGQQASRFGVSSDEWESGIKPALARKLDLNTNQLRLELAIEANVVPQLYPHMSRKNDGKTNTWAWYEEFFEDRAGRLFGGGSDGGGLENVDHGDADSHWVSRSFRSLAVL
jgi:hypothetical protein